MTAQDMQKMKVIDGLIPEPIGGAHMDFEMTAKNIRSAITKNLLELSEIPMPELLNARIEKFRNMGICKS
jgi:acetyl-CoA carboxylase carboxyl transferase subunit alpha